MPSQYHAQDPRTNLEVQVTGEFPPDPDDRVRIARTTNLFTRLLSTILATQEEAERRERFRAIETQLEVADALVRGDMGEVQRLVRETLRQMGVTDEQLREAEQQLREQIERMGGSPPESLFGPPDEEPPDTGPDPRYPEG
jgi:hypothetical protein